MVTCKDAWPQFGKDDVDVIRFASIRFDHALDEHDRASVTRAIESRTTSIASWTPVAERTYALVRSKESLDAAPIAALGATLHVPPLVVLRVRPVHLPSLPSLAHALAGPGRPAAVLSAHTTTHEVLLELEPSGRGLALALALVDAVLVATPGRIVEPVLPISDAVLAEFASFRLRDAEIDRTRVLDVYVEHLLETQAARS